LREEKEEGKKTGRKMPPELLTTYLQIRTNPSGTDGTQQGQGQGIGKGRKRRRKLADKWVKRRKKKKKQ